MCQFESCNNTLTLSFDKTQLRSSFTTTGNLPGNLNGFLGTAVVIGYDSNLQLYRIFFNISSIDDQPTLDILYNTVQVTVVSVANPNKNIFTGTFNTTVNRVNYDNIPSLYISDNGSKFFVPENSDSRTLVLTLN